jgi:uncharacterized protein
VEHDELAAPRTSAPRSGPETPVAGAGRIEIIDILRGFAIFGILLVNMQFFFSPAYVAIMPEFQPWTGTLDKIADTLIAFFGQGKFYSLFSMLFGMGMAIQMERAEARGAPVAAFFARRMFWLLWIALAHAVLLWFGDILFIYSVLGFILIAFRKRKPITLGVWMIVLLAIPMLLGLAFVGLLELASINPETAAQIEEGFEQNRVSMESFVEEAYATYTSRSFIEVTGIRTREWWSIVSTNLFNLGPQILALFLVGLYLGRRRFFHDIPQHLSTVRRAFPWLLAGGLLGSTILVVGREFASFTEPSAVNLLVFVGMILGAPILSGAYVAGIVLLVQRESWHRRLAPLAYVGRMALTNYLMHSVVFTMISYGYGLGFYGRISPSAGLGLTVVTYLLQIPFSKWWLGRFRFGPMEWLWRSLTYWKLQPMRRV